MQFESIRKIKAWRTTKHPVKRMISDSESTRILAKSKRPLTYPMVVLQLAIGPRIAEAIAVRCSDFDSESGELKVRFQIKRRKNTKLSEQSPRTKSVLEQVALLRSKAEKRDIFVIDDARELLVTGILLLCRRSGAHSVSNVAILPSCTLATRVCWRTSQL